MSMVTFEWFNMGPNQIWVTSIVGCPSEASPGRIMPCTVEDRLKATTSVFLIPVGIGKDITIKWKENGKDGWPGGLEVPGTIPPGQEHQAKFTRDDLGLASEMKNTRVRLTYWGNDKWRIVQF